MAYPPKDPDAGTPQDERIAQLEANGYTVLAPNVWRKHLDDLAAANALLVAAGADNARLEAKLDQAHRDVVTLSGLAVNAGVDVAIVLKWLGGPHVHVESDERCWYWYSNLGERCDGACGDHHRSHAFLPKPQPEPEVTGS